MGIDRHVGRGSPTFVVEGNPDSFIRLIKQHGVLSRVCRARKCPCVTVSGSPNIYCKLCKGDGFVYDFQRKFLQADEDSDVKSDRSLVLPFRVPILEPLSVEKLLPPEQGGIVDYNIDSFDAFGIKISAPSGKTLPHHFNKMRVSYFFDRYSYVNEERVIVNSTLRTLTTVKTLFDDEHRTSNFQNAHGDITIINKIVSASTGFEYKDYSFRKNVIILRESDPIPQENDILVDYFFAPATKILPSDLNNQERKGEKWESALQQGAVKIGLEPWYELSQGDLITFLVPELFREEIIVHSSHSMDNIFEFDVSRVHDEIFDEDGRKYRINIDYILQPYRNIVWIGSQPNPGKKISIRYGYHPTYIIFEDNPQPNALENKQYPVTVLGKSWSKIDKDGVAKLRNG